jgi:uncharacterized protein YcbK (DUF882 family)
MKGASLASAVTGAARWSGWRRKFAILGGVAAYAWLHAPSSTQPAIADGDTRSLTFVNRHTNETGSFTFRVNGQYDEAALEKLNWFMRDWRLNEQTKMDPKLFDILWDVYRQSGSSQPIDVLSGYRSPQTNAMLRRRSRQVAEHSQHMQGKAVDAHFIDVGPGPIRDIAMRMQEGGVGFYPIGSTPWVHIDSGTVRYWPRMSRTALARLFPDGKTVFIPADGQPMDGYEQAKAMIEARGGDVQVASSSGGGLFGWLFGGARGGGADDDEESGGARVIASGRGGTMVMASGGRGGQAAMAATTPAPANEAPPAEPSPTPAVATDPSAGDPAAAAATAEADPGDATVATADTTPPESAAPLPPRKPAELFLIDTVAPMPPRRPMELAIAPTDGKEGVSTDGDLIATLIERNSLPSAITKGVRAAPKSALSLVEAKPGADVDGNALARAAALATPPLPPARPRLDSSGVTAVEKSPPTPPTRPTKTLKPSASNPYGSLVVDAFDAPNPPDDAAKSLRELRGSTP